MTLYFTLDKNTETVYGFGESNTLSLEMALDYADDVDHLITEKYSTDQNWNEYAMIDDVVIEDGTISFQKRFRYITVRISQFHESNKISNHEKSFELWSDVYEMIDKELSDMNIDFAFEHEDGTFGELVWFTDSDRDQLTENEIERIINTTIFSIVKISEEIEETNEN